MKLLKSLFLFFVLTASIGTVWAKASRSNVKAIPTHAHDADWYIQPPVEFKKFQTPLETLLKQSRDEKFLKTVHRKIKKATLLINKPTQDAISDLHIQKNRHNFFYPFDETRTARDLEGFYLSGNDVYTAQHEYIITQGPLEHTVNDFWKAILHRDSRVIVTLVMAQEDGREKCAGFWESSRFPLIVDNWKITLEKVDIVATSLLNPDHQIVKRTFLATSPNTLKTHQITQIHYENWPDRGIPNLDLFCQLLDVVDNSLKKAKTPITVHCSAGIGRSGTFVAAHSLRAEIQHIQKSSKKKKVLVNVPEAIFLLRCQRPSVVGNKEQIRVIYQALARASK